MNDDIEIDVAGPVARPGRILGTKAKVAAVVLGAATFAAGVFVAVKVGGKYGVVPAALAQLGVGVVGVGATYGALWAFSEEVDDVGPADLFLPTFGRYVGDAANRYVGVIG